MMLIKIAKLVLILTWLVFSIKHENYVIFVWLACSLFVIPMKRHKRE